MRAHPTRDSSTTPAGQLVEAGLRGLIGYQLAQATIATDQVFKARVGGPFGLRPVEYTVMTLIKENPGGSPAQLAQALAVTAPNISMWIDRLVQRGFAERSPSPTDRRAQVLALTTEGARVTALATQMLLEGERDGFAHLSVGERSILVELLHKVALGRSSKQRQRRSGPKATPAANAVQTDEVNRR